MIIMTRRCVVCKNDVARSKVKVTVHAYGLCVGLNENSSCPAHNFVVGPASGMVRCRDLVFHSFVRSHQGAILFNTLDGGISGHISFLVFFIVWMLWSSCKTLSKRCNFLLL